MSTDNDDKRIDDAVDVILRWGSFDDAHHKQWALDQALRALLGDGYAARVARENDERVSAGYDPWEEGVAP
jgi:hypothetical protein